MIAATLGIAGLSRTVRAHHMFATGAVLLPFFSLLSFFIAIPTGIKSFQLGRHQTARRPGRAAPVPVPSAGGGLSRRKPAAPRGVNCACG